MCRFAGVPSYIRNSQRRHGTSEEQPDTKTLKKAKTPIGRLDDKWTGKSEAMEPQKDIDPYAPFPDDKNPETGEIGGPKGPEPTRYGDWERKGRVIDF